MRTASLGNYADLSWDERAICRFERYKAQYLEIVEQLQNLKSDPSHDKAYAAALNEKVDTLYELLQTTAESYSHLALPPKYTENASCKRIDIKHWAQENPREYAVFMRFEKAKEGYLALVKQVDFLKSIPHCDPSLIERNIECLEHKYCWMQQFAAAHSDLVLELPLRQHTCPIVSGTKI